ncbi:MAG: transporter substrate-binding domain-containing protein [Bacteriovoracaceae bacterium]|nr:transporter substrate-binding domain-containing protein [Bacteriovoracaceae bacterium]
MKYITVVLLLYLINLSYGADKLKSHIDKVEFGGLKSILKKRYMRVLTTKNAYDYYIYQGKTKGMQYEMAREFTKYLNKKYIKKGKLRIVFDMVPVNFDQLIPMLITGKGDIIAVGITKTAKREALVDFTDPYQIVDDVIVTRKELASQTWKHKTFHVQKNSSYFNSLSQHFGLVKVKEVDANLHAGHIMEFVSLKKHDYTLVNSFWAETVGKRYPNLVILKDRPFRKGVKISWAVRKKNHRLLKELNSFLPRVKKGTRLGNIFSKRYFYDIGRIKSKDFDLATSKISKYDESIKKYAKKYGFDWRLLSALCYQESRFNQSIKNKWGAIGLFQVKQKTANEPYIAIRNITGEANYENNIHAGVKYLAWIKKRYLDPIKKIGEESKLRMTMAAYNAGPGRLLKAMKKAKKMGLNSHKWFRNVELAMLKLGYPEPVVYVSEINKHYVSYLLLGIK